LDLTLYGQWVQNLDRLEPEPRLPVVNDNAEGRLHTGLELAATLALTEQVAGYVNYALTLVYDPDRDDWVRDFPQHLFGVGFDIRLPYSIQMVFDANYIAGFAPFQLISSGQSTTFEVTPTDPRLLLDLKLSRSFLDQRVELFIAGTNLLGFFQNAEAVTEFPSEYARPYGASFLLGTQIRGL
ncbi:MAG: hypothetical protein RBU37_22405, partial [Myxococcota bacterium]|nr:hypothetical protein [Myxococcota bacterium]